MRLGIDIGGTKTAVALVGPGGEVLALRSVPSGRGPEDVVRTAVRLAREVAGATPDVEVGACMPGLVDPRTGLVRHAVNLAVESLDLAGELGRSLGVEVTVENDVKAAALGAWRLRARAGRGRAGEALAYLNLGTGLASAVVRDGMVVRGIDGVAGEIGHLPIGGDAPCSCGQVGCLETVASGTALARLWPASLRTVRNPFDAARHGDAAAAAAVDVLCSGVGLAIQLLALASGADHVVIGGGLSGLGEPLREGIRADLVRRARASHMIGALGLPDRFELLPPDLPVAALGAAWLGSGESVDGGGAGGVSTDAAGGVPTDAAGGVPTDAVGVDPTNAAGAVPTDAAGGIPGVDGALQAPGGPPLARAGTLGALPGGMLA